MRIDKVFVSISARDFDAQAQWWTRLLGRRWDREPMPSCREWDVAGSVLLQVLDDPDQSQVGTATVTLHVGDLDAEIGRLHKAGIEVPDPVPVEGFASLRYTRFNDPEGNTVGLLDGA